MRQLPKVVNANFPSDPDRMSVSGHSMGGHGALVCALRNPGKYKVARVEGSNPSPRSGGRGLLTHFLSVPQAVSALAPICNPSQCPWGQKAFSGYLGNDRSTWEVRAPRGPP